MILKIQQTKKELFSAAFDILHKEERVGTISVSGKLGSLEADIRVNVFGNIFTMKYAGGLFAEQKIKKGYKSYRKYSISDATNDGGYIYQVDWQQKLFLTTSYHEMEYKGMRYNSYVVSLPAEGGRQSVYREGVQVAQINIPREVVNDLYNYTIYALDQKEAEMCAIICAYIYINAHFKPGEKAIKSYVKYYTTGTKDAFLLEKYNPDFVETIEE